MKRPARQAWRRRINWPKVGIHKSHIHIFQVIPSAFKLHQTAHHLQISIPLLSEIAGHLFEPCPADPQILLWCKRILAAIYLPNIQQYPAISSNIQQYPAISSNIQLYTIPCSESRNAMSSASPHREFNSLCSMMRDHVLISGKVNSFAWHNLDRSTTGANMMQDSLQITPKYQDCTPPKLNRAERQQAEQVSQHLGSVRQLNEVYIYYILQTRKESFYSNIL